MEEILLLLQNKHSPASGARSTKRWVRGAGDMDGKLKKQLPVRTQMVWYLLAIVLILVASGLRVLDRGMYNSFWSVWLQLLRHMIHIGLLIGWMISIQSRILQRPVRRYLLAIGCMLSFWLFVRA